MKYNTQQKSSITELLEKTGRPLTCAEISDFLPEIGRSSIFRILKSLEEDGTLQSTIKGRSRVYSIKGKECSHHLHCSCTQCGRIVHLDEETSEAIKKLLLDKGIVLAEGTVISSICPSCMEKIKQ